MISSTNGKKIAKVLGQFDFVATQKLMDYFEWEWTLSKGDVVEDVLCGIPQVSDLVDMAYYLLVKAVSGTGFCASGGFEATFNEGELTLKFVTDEAQMPKEDFVYEPILPVCIGSI